MYHLGHVLGLRAVCSGQSCDTEAERSTAGRRRTVQHSPGAPDAGACCAGDDALRRRGTVGTCEARVPCAARCPDGSLVVGVNACGAGPKGRVCAAHTAVGWRQV